MNLLETLETDEKGEAMSKQYPVVNRKYYLKEIKTVEGYSFSSELIEVSLIGNSIKDVFVKNAKEPKEPDIVVVEETPEPEVVTVVKEPEPIKKVIMGEPKIIEEVIPLPKTGM